MTPTQNGKDQRGARSNRAIALACVAFFAGMVGVAYAAVPLYNLFCKVTGYGGTTQRATQYSDTVLDREITVRFDANVSGLPWDFAPIQREVTMNIGETTQIAYRAENVSSQPTTGRASFNVSPPAAGAYFMKVECFCFTDTTLKPGEAMNMPVVFYVDPAVVDVTELKNTSAITLSYTFFPIASDEPVAATRVETGQGKPLADTEIGG